MKKSLVIATISLLTMGSASVMASEVTGLNEFVSGTAAKAADVNANFTAVKNAVDDNDARITATEAAINTKAPIIHGHAGEDISSGTVAEPRIDAAIARDNEIMSKVLSSDGAGSGLDADTLDGLNSSAFAQTSAVVGIVNTAPNVDADTLDNLDSSDFALATHTHSTSDLTGTISPTQIDNAIARDDEIMPKVLSSDGTGSGLDADTLDGQSLIYFATSSEASGLDDRITDIENGVGISGCPSDMVKVGPICVDKYEASLWDSATGGDPINADTCAENGNNCSAKDNTGATNTSAIYARSVLDVIPSSNITWFQAQQACANVGKRLLTNAEWQMTAAGTPDLGATNDTANKCNTGAGNPITGTLAPTGSSAFGTNACVSNWGAFDMIGNVNEWVADWTQGATNNTVNNVALSIDGVSVTSTTSITNPNYTSSTSNMGANYGNDAATAVQPAGNQGTNGTNSPAAIYRGGSFNGGTYAGVFAFSAAAAPSYKNNNIGFRCAR